MFIHELKDAKELFEAVAGEKGIRPYLVEKDYWIMHALYGLKTQGFDFELKGGTSLSKGYNIIERFSEDLDIRIHPQNDDDIKTGRNHDKPSHIESRRKFFENLLVSINIHGMIAVRDESYDDAKMRNAGIILQYENLFASEPGIKQGILLEVGFDQTTPFDLKNISSWAFQKALSIENNITNNQAENIKCYFPEYTFVEKLQAISTKVRKQQESGEFDTNFLRHFYDIYKLLQQDRVLKFIGSDEYFAHKNLRFRQNDELDLKKNLAFNLDANIGIYNKYKTEFQKITPLFMFSIPKFDEIYNQIADFRDKLNG